MVREFVADLARAANKLKHLLWRTRRRQSAATILKGRRGVTKVFELIAEDAPVEEVVSRLIEVARIELADSNIGVILEHGDARSFGNVARDDSKATWILPIASPRQGPFGSFIISTPKTARLRPRQRRFVQYLSRVAQVALTRERERERLQYRATHDGLTGLPTRGLFHDRLELALASDRRHGSGIAVGIIDLNRFKAVNDTLGHAAGDELLKQFANRCVDALRQGETIARMGGDEFMLLLHDVTSREQVERVLERVNECVAEPFVLEGQEVFISAAIGAAIAAPASTISAKALINQADAAMYRAKRDSVGYIVATASITGQITTPNGSDLQLESELYRALEHNQLELYYQTKVWGDTGRPFGSEALLRWTRSNGERVPPDRFIPLAERTGLIIPIGAWVLEQSCRQAKAWTDAGVRLHLCVNVSGKQFRQVSLVQTIRRALETSGLDADQLNLEVTESLVLDSQQYEDVFVTIKNMGAHIVLDDFGTGYSSLSRLREIPLSMIKVDRSFIASLGAEDTVDERSRGAEIVRAIVSLAKTLGLQMIAEGVETEAQRRFLLKVGCKMMQGFLFSHPEPAAAFAARIRAGRVGIQA